MLPYLASPFPLHVSPADGSPHWLAGFLGSYLRRLLCPFARLWPPPLVDSRPRAPQPRPRPAKYLPSSPRVVAYFLGAPMPSPAAAVSPVSLRNGMSKRSWDQANPGGLGPVEVNGPHAHSSPVAASLYGAGAVQQSSPQNDPGSAAPAPASARPVEPPPHTNGDATAGHIPMISRKIKGAFRPPRAATGAHLWGLTTFLGLGSMRFLPETQGKSYGPRWRAWVVRPAACANHLVLTGAD